MPATKTAPLSDQDYLRKHKDHLNESTQHAKWIANTNTHEDHTGQTLATRDHDVIRDWAEERRAQPSTIKGGKRYGTRPGVLRFDFPGYAEGQLETVSWDEWFETFDQRDLVMLFQEHLKNGNTSNFFKFDSPHREQG